VRPWPILTGPLQGARLCTSPRAYPRGVLGLAERPLLAWIAQHVKAGQTWVDAGAYTGYTTIALARAVGPSGRVVAFEPMPSIAGQLAETIRINRLPQASAICLALDDSPGVQLTRTATYHAMADRETPARADDPIIASIALDACWPALGDPRIDGVKMDVNGSELAALRGMAELLRRDRPVLVLEVHRGVDRGTLLHDLAGSGYRLTSSIDGGEAAELRDDHSYVFSPASDPVVRHVEHSGMR
jgi:FkbM family methyltransferase